MIRDRRDEDLERLSAILTTIEDSSHLLSGAHPAAWLQEHRAERSWVFDMAPMTVAPTKNVVGHLQIYDPANVSVDLSRHPQLSVGQFLAIGKVFVQPQTSAHGIARFLLTESVRYIQRQARHPVLTLSENGLTQEFFERYGFEELLAGSPDGQMIYTGRRARPVVR